MDTFNAVVVAPTEPGEWSWFFTADNGHRWAVPVTVPDPQSGEQGEPVWGEEAGVLLPIMAAKCAGGELTQIAVFDQQGRGRVWGISADPVTRTLTEFAEETATA